MLYKKHSLKSGNSKAEKKNLKQKRLETKTEKILMKRKLAIEYFDVVTFMKESKEERKIKKETKTRNQKKAKNKDKKE